MNNGYPKVITGIRRCGKSSLLKGLFSSYLKDNGVKEEQILSIELDDDKNVFFRDPIRLGEFVRNWCRGKGQCFVFLDEIQKVLTISNPAFMDGKHRIAKETDVDTISFVDVVLGLSREKNIDLYVTGSNSRMLSVDVITEFRDKATNISIGPLSFEEYSSYVSLNPDKALYGYMLYGGMPYAVDLKREDKEKYLNSLFDTVYFRNILEHNHLRRKEFMDELCNLISECTGELMNANRIANTYQGRAHRKIDSGTVETYFGYFEDYFLIREARRYDVKGREEIGSLKKYYFSDVGLRNARVRFAFSDRGQILENIVFIELVYHGYSVHVGIFDRIGKDENQRSIRSTYEIDFLAVKGLRQYYIQVCSGFSSDATYQRKIKPYLYLNDQIQKIIVVDAPMPETHDRNGFTLIGILDFLLDFLD